MPEIMPSCSFKVLSSSFMSTDDQKHSSSFLCVLLMTGASTLSGSRRGISKNGAAFWTDLVDGILAHKTKAR